MTKNELSEFIRDIKKDYPDGSYDLGEWWDMFREFNVSTLYDGLTEWKEGQFGYRTPSVRDIRFTNQCCIWNPNGIFYKAMVRVRDTYEKQHKGTEEKTDESFQEVMQELRYK